MDGVTTIGTTSGLASASILSVASPPNTAYAIPTMATIATSVTTILFFMMRPPWPRLWSRGIRPAELWERLHPPHREMQSRGPEQRADYRDGGVHHLLMFDRVGHVDELRIEQLIAEPDAHVRIREDVPIPETGVRHLYSRCIAGRDIQPSLVMPPRGDHRMRNERRKPQP